MSKLNDFIPILKETLSNDKDFIMPVNGTSMLPFINKNNKVILTSSQEFKKNDIILYQRLNGQYVLHRIYKVKKNHFVLLGDNQIIKEEPIYKDQIIGKVKAIIKKNKTVYLKGFHYNMYLFFWNNLIIRRLLFFITRRIKYE